MARYMLCALLVIVSLILQGTAAAGPTPSTPLPDIVAEVNGHKISSRDYYNRLERAPVAGGQAEKPVEMGLLVLRDLINEVLLVQLAEQERCAPTEAQVSERYAEMQKQPEFGARMKEYGMTDAQARDLVRVLQAHFNLLTRGIEVSPKDIVDFYNTNQKTMFRTPRNAEVACVFVESKADADNAMALLKKGVAFGEVAKQLSSDPVSKDRGGRLQRPIYENDPYLPPTVWKKVIGTKEGAYTQPLGDQAGWAIFEVIRHNPEKIQKLPEVRFLIRDSLMREKGAAKWNIDDELNKFRERSDIKIMIDRYRNRLFSPNDAADRSTGEGC